MKFGRNIAFLLSLVAVLAGALAVFRLSRPEALPQGGDPLFPMPPETVLGVVWEAEGPDGRQVPVELRREGDSWYMTRPYSGAMCDAVAVADLLDTAQSLRILARLGDKATTDFRPERSLTLRTVDSARTCGFGDVLPMRLSETLAEVGGTLVSVEAATVARLPTRVAPLRTRAVLPMEPDRLLSLEWRAPGRPFTRAQRMANGNWGITQPFPFEAQASQVAPALRTLTDVRAVAAYVLPADGDAFGPDGLARPCPTSESTLASYGLDEEGAIRVTVHARGIGEALTLRFGKEDPARPGNVFCLLNGAQAIVSVPSALRDVFGPQGPFVTDYRNLPVLGDAVRPQRLTLRVSPGDAPTELVMIRGGWSIVLPVNLPADAVAMRELVRGLSELTGDLTGEEPPSTPTLCTLTLTPKDGALAKLSLHTSASGDDVLLAYRSDLRRLYRVRREAVPEVLLRGGFAHALADRTVFAEPVANIRRISLLRRDGSHVSVVRPGPALDWETESPKGAYIDVATLDAWLTLFADFKAVRVLRGVPTAFGALRPYGLDNPSLRLMLDLESEDGLRRVLLVGAPDPTTGAAPALVQGRSILYELNAETVRLLNRPLAVQERAP